MYLTDEERATFKKRDQSEYLAARQHILGLWRRDGSKRLSLESVKAAQPGSPAEGLSDASLASAFRFLAEHGQINWGLEGAPGPSVDELASKAAVPSKAVLLEKLYAVLRTTDLQTATEKSIRRELEADCGVDLTDFKLLFRRHINHVMEHVDERETVEPLPEDEATEDAASAAAPKSKRVIVIGAGMAGLSAACTLQASGAEVLVLEASSRVGGRLCTETSTLGTDVAVDMGPAVVPLQPSWHPLVALCKRLGLALQPVMVGACLAQLPVRDTETGQLCSEEVVAEAKRLAEKVLSAASARLASLEQPAAAAISMQAAVDQAWNDLDLPSTPTVQQLLQLHWAQLELQLGAPLASTSLLQLPHLMSLHLQQTAGNGAAHLDDDGVVPMGDRALGSETGAAGWPQLCTVSGGLQQLATALATGLDVRLDAAVTHVAQQAQRVSVTLASGEVLQAAGVICSIPLSSLRSSTISFEPAFPGWKAEALARLGLAPPSIKVAFRFAASSSLSSNTFAAAALRTTPHPSSAADMGAADGGSHRQLNGPAEDCNMGTAGVQWLFDLRQLEGVEGGSVVEATALPSAVKQLAALDDEQLSSSALQALQSLQPVPASSPEEASSLLKPVSTLVSRWPPVDSTMLGSTSYLAVGAAGGTRDYRLAALPLKRTLLFAGEHTVVDRSNGVVAAAVSSGMREAARASKVLRGEDNLEVEDEPPTSTYMLRADKAAVAAVIAAAGEGAPRIKGRAVPLPKAKRKREEKKTESDDDIIDDGDEESDQGKRRKDSKGGSKRKSTAASSGDSGDSASDQDQGGEASGQDKKGGSRTKRDGKGGQKGDGEKKKRKRKDDEEEAKPVFDPLDPVQVAAAAARREVARVDAKNLYKALLQAQQGNMERLMELMGTCSNNLDSQQACLHALSQAKVEALTHMAKHVPFLTAIKSWLLEFCEESSTEHLVLAMLRLMERLRCKHTDASESGALKAVKHIVDQHRSKDVRKQAAQVLAVWTPATAAGPSSAALGGTGAAGVGVGVAAKAGGAAATSAAASGGAAGGSRPGGVVPVVSNGAARAVCVVRPAAAGGVAADPAKASSVAKAPPRPIAAITAAAVRTDSPAEPLSEYDQLLQQQIAQAEEAIRLAQEEAALLAAQRQQDQAHYAANLPAELPDIATFDDFKRSSGGVKGGSKSGEQEKGSKLHRGGGDKGGSDRGSSKDRERERRSELKGRLHEGNEGASKRQRPSSSSTGSSSKAGGGEGSSARVGSNGVGSRSGSSGPGLSEASKLKAAISDCAKHTLKPAVRDRRITEDQYRTILQKVLLKSTDHIKTTDGRFDSKAQQSVSSLCEKYLQKSKRV